MSADRVMDVTEEEREVCVLGGWGRSVGASHYGVLFTGNTNATGSVFIFVRIQYCSLSGLE